MSEKLLITKYNMIHVIRESNTRNGEHNLWQTECGKWTTEPKYLIDLNAPVPKWATICSKCQKMIDAMKKEVNK